MAPLSRGLRLTTGLVTLLLRTLQPRLHLARSQVSLHRLCEGNNARTDSSRVLHVLPDLIACKVRPVWALPISLATTLGIVVTFFSSRY